MYLLDTNHCRLIQQALNNPALIHRIQIVGEANIATTIITAGELVYMAENSTYRKENLSRIHLLPKTLQELLGCRNPTRFAARFFAFSPRRSYFTVVAGEACPAIC